MEECWEGGRERVRERDRGIEGEEIERGREMEGEGERRRDGHM